MLDLRPSPPQSPGVPASQSAALDPARSRFGDWREIARFLLTFFLLALGLRSCIVMPRSIPSESMMPRLLVGDYVLVAKWPYGWSRFSLPWPPPAPHGRLLGRLPRRGDVVVFRAPPADDQDYIKRVIGLPGDRVQMRHGALWLNGRPVKRARLPDFVIPIAPNTECSSIRNIRVPYGPGASYEGKPTCRFMRWRETLPDGASYDTLDQGQTPQDNTPVITVPPGHIFLMGDNRDMSEDSRFSTAAGGIGLVPAENLEGRALVTFFSTDGSATWWNPLSWWRATRFARIGRGFQ
ncbi:MAG TPA: signal peptidase I [Sphingomonas sp.]|nr:signal peptidase I [Sphingomonas sp.]